MVDHPIPPRAGTVQPIPFLFEGDNLVRCISIDGLPWFVVVDICRILGIKNAAQATEALDEDEKGICLIDTLGGAQELWVVNESGLYTLILRSRAATTAGTVSHKFRKWVTSELLPSLRSTGRYEMTIHPPASTHPADEAELSVEMKDRLINTAVRCGGSQAGAEMWLHFNLWRVPSIVRHALARPKQLDLFAPPFEVP